MNQETVVTNLQRVWNRLRILAIAMKDGSLEESDISEMGSMIEDLLVENFQPAIDALKNEKGDK